MQSALSSQSTHSFFLATFSSLLMYLSAYGCATIVYKFQKLRSIILLSLIIPSLVGCALNTEIKSNLGSSIYSAPPPFTTLQDYHHKISVISASPKNRGFTECVENGLRSRLKNSTIISEESFRDLISPWFELCNKPSNESELKAVLSNPLINRRLNEIGLDFIIYVEGSTRWRESGKVVGGDFIVMGYAQKERKSNIVTTIVDINSSKLLGDTVVRSKGIIAIPIFMLFAPIPIGLATETSACRQTVQHIAKYLMGESLCDQNVVEDDEEANNLDKNLLKQTDTDSERISDSNSDLIDYYKRSALEENADAQYRFGLIYYSGNGVEQNYHEALKWWLKSAEQGHVYAQYGLGMMYLEGKGIHDPREAVRWLKKAADQDFPAAIESLKLLKESSKYAIYNRKEVINWIKNKAENGQAESHYRLGVMHEQSNDVEKDFDEASRWYKRAANQGYAPAQDTLGEIYKDGQGVAQDNKEALKWYKRAAEQGHAESMFKISEMYFWGEGLPFDKKEAIRYCLKAANMGHGGAQCTMGFRYPDHKVGPNSYLDSLLEEYKWLWLCSQNKGASESMRASASNTLGYHSSKLSEGQLEYAMIIAREWQPIQAKGSDIQKYTEKLNNLDKSNKWKMANRRGHQQAITSLASVSDKLTIEGLREAAEQGYADAQYNLGLIYYEGEGVAQDYEEAAKWYRKAAEQGYISAQIALGGIYYCGQGVPLNYLDAIKWFRKPHEQGYPENYFFQKFLDKENNCGQDIAEDGQDQVEELRQAAEQGFADAQYKFGLIHENGEGVNQNATKAAKWYKKAAEQGYLVAQKKLEELCGEIPEACK